MSVLNNLLVSVVGTYKNQSFPESSFSHVLHPLRKVLALNAPAESSSY